MQGFLQWFLEAERLNGAAIKIDLPTARQTTEYSCGAAALRSIGEFYGMGEHDEQKWIKLVKATPKLGSSPPDIIRAAKFLGFKVESKENMSVQELQSHIDKKHPVICDIQAWGNKRQYKKDESGHYVVAIGYDTQNIYFMDPSTRGSRGVIKKSEFLDRWHDKEDKNNKYRRLGIVVYKDVSGRKPQNLHKGVKVR